MSEVDFGSEDPLEDGSFSDSDFSDSGFDTDDPGSTGVGGGFEEAGEFEEAGFEEPAAFAEGDYDQGYEQAGEYQQEAPVAPVGPLEKPPLNVYTVMLFISLISLIIGIISLSIQLGKYGA